MLISIVMAYYNRKPQFLRTLESIKRSNIKDFELIIVDDASDIEHRLEDTAAQHPFIKLIRVEPKDKWYVNPCIPYNMGFAKATGDIIIIQNPECYHYDDILDFTSKNLEVNDYFSFACYSLSQKTTATFSNLPLNTISLIDKAITADGQDGWYNHSIFRPLGYHFCSAIYKSSLSDLRGFNPKYAYGIGYDDDELLHRIRMKKMNIKIIDNIKVLHQWHDSFNYKRNNLNVLVEKNKNLFFNVSKNNNSVYYE